MANNFVASVAKALALEVEHVETYWKKAQAIATKNGKTTENSNFYAYVTGIFKRLLSDDQDAKLTKEGKLLLPRAEAIMARYRQLGDDDLHEESAMQKKLKANQQRKEKDAADIADGTKPDPTKAAVKPAPTASVTKPEPAEKSNDKPAADADKKAAKSKDNFNLPADATDAEKVLARDLAELYKEMLIRWEALSDSATVNLDGEADLADMTWHKDNPYGQLPPVVREVLQAGAALHYDSLSDVRNLAKQAMMSWQATQPTLLDEMKAIEALPTLHRRALLPLMQELVKQGNMPESILELVKKNTTSSSDDWLNVFPSLLANNAAQTPDFNENVCDAVTDTLVACLLS